jgi:hypothetical protein
MTFEELYKQTYTIYYIKLDNKGNFKEGKGIIPNTIVKAVEKEMKNYLTKRRKTNVFIELTWNNKRKDINTIYLISESKYNKVRGWI